MLGPPMLDLYQLCMTLCVGNICNCCLLLILGGSFRLEFAHISISAYSMLSVIVPMYFMYIMCIHCFCTLCAYASGEWPEL